MWNQAEDMLYALQMAAYKVDTAEGTVPGVGKVTVDKVENTTRGYGPSRYHWTLDGKKVTKASIWRKARG